jgi:GAF domain-containing protein
MSIEVLCVDGDGRRRDRTAASLAEAGMAVREASTVVAAERTLEAAAPDAVVSKHHLPDGTGIDLFDRVRRLAPDAACLLFSGVSLDRIDPPALGEPVAEYVDSSRPGALDNLPERVRRAAGDRTHTAYPLPDDEAGRLDAIAACAPIGPSPELDGIVDRAAGELSTAVAMVGIVEAHRERAVAICGADWDPVPRQDTVCAHAICTDGVTVIPDLTADARFSRAEPLLERDLRAYAGAPVTDPGGHTLGMLCVFDERPRQFTAGERATLRRLAAAVSEHLAPSPDGAHA